MERLQNRTLIRVSGEEARHFLENLITCDINSIENGDARFGALLTPQGKILFDFFVFMETDAYFFDISAGLADAFAKRLMFYRLRARVDIEVCDPVDVTACWDTPRPDSPRAYQDARHPDMGYRIYGDADEGSDTGSYARKRIALNVPEGGADFEYGDAYPHETLMDQFGG